MWEFWGKSLRGRMLLVSLIIVNIPILVASYAMKHSAEQSLLAEKKSKLAAITVLFDSRLGPQGYEGILKRYGVHEGTKEEKLRILNRELMVITDEIAASSPGLGAGYYAKDLDAIVTYGPSQQFGYTVGWAIRSDHPGRQVMNNNEFRVEFGTLVRGNIMNAMRPLQRDGAVIGYVFVNELTDDVRAQVAAMDKSISISVIVGIILSLLLIISLTEGMMRDVQSVIYGVKELKFNLRRRITGLKGEMGEVAATINEMATALVNARSLSENIMDSIADGLIAVDTQGKITAFNRAAEQMTGFTQQDVMGKFYEEVFHMERYCPSLLIDTLRTGESHIAGELRYPVKNGTLWISTTTSLLRNLNGEIIGAVVVFKDLTERKQLEEQVTRAERLASLGELAAGVAHEIRNPLTGIKGFLQYFQTAGTEEERQKYLPMLLREVDRMNKIIEGLLYFARPCQAALALTDLNRVIQDTMMLIRSRAQHQGIVFTINLPADLPQVELDEEQYKQVFLNLFINSVQAMEQAGSVHVSGRYIREADAVELSFADNGPGIEEHLKKKVFDPFFTTKKTGTGLGLSVVHRLVTAQGGNVFLEDNPGGGTIVRLIIPRMRKGESPDDERKDPGSR